MRDMTNDQLRDLGWTWALRYNGRVMALTISSFDAARWKDERIGVVVNLKTGETWHTES